MENYHDILTHLLNHSENEVVEFKAAKNSFDVDDLRNSFSSWPIMLERTDSNAQKRSLSWKTVFLIQRISWESRHI